MDHSGNSGSIQSSSGGDDQENNSNVLNPSQATFGTFFDPSSSQNLEAFSHSQPNNTLYNLDSLWSKTLLRSNPQFTPFEKPQFPNSSIDHQSGATNDQKKVTKNPKKRARASRKAPTTVLTTNTTNFRQMVQEFTGIRADPFNPATLSRRPYPPSSSSSATFFPNTSSTIVDALGTTATTNNNYRPPFSGNSMENQILSFQTLLQSQGASRSNDSLGVNQNLGGF